MIFLYSRKFVKAFAKLPEKFRKSFYRRLNVFTKNKFDPFLNNHKLHGEYAGCNSIDVTGDIRAIYEEVDGVVTFITIGSHSELYE